jgi:hypothetical protein
MPVRVRVTPFANSVKILVDSRLSPQARSERVAAFAADRIAKADEINRQALGTVPPKTVTVDGREGAALASVNPDHGIIIAEWRMVIDVVEWIGKTLKDRSPVLSGQYRDSHTLYADSVEADWDHPPIAQMYTFLNPLPYARKIEIGKTESGRDFVIQVPNRIYERTADDAQAKFGNIAKIRFTYQAAIGGRIASKHGKDDRVPAIVVTLR